MEDIFNGAFAEFVEYFPRSRASEEPGSARPYLLRLIRSQLYHYFEYEHIRACYCEEIGFIEIDDYSPEIKAIMDGVLTSDVLPERQRMAAGYYFAMEYSSGTISRILGRHRSSVCRLVEKARWALQKIFRRAGYTPEEMFYD